VNMKLPLNLVVYATPPAPVVLVSTIDEKKKKNVAPFAFFATCSHIPPMVCFGTRKETDTYKNIMKTKEFVVSIPSPDIVDKVWSCGKKVEDEFKHSGLTPIKPKKVKPYRIKECQTNLECVFRWKKKTGDHILIIGEVVEADVNKKVFSKEKWKLRTKLNPLYHVTRNHFILGRGKYTVLEV